MDAESSAKYLKSLGCPAPRVGLVLGSGLGEVASAIQGGDSVPYKDIPDFCPPTVPGHEGCLRWGRFGEVETVALRGRVHFYEGHDLKRVTFPIRVLAKLGVTHLIITNASGAINPTFRPGDLVCISDHLNLIGANPLTGANDETCDPRFPDMSDPYPLCQELINASPEGKKGVYAAVPGPSYETPAEVRMLAAMGADMVGMSTTPETIVANYLGLRVGGISCITNLAAGLSDSPLSHQEVQDVSKTAGKKLHRLIEKALRSLPS